MSLLQNWLNADLFSQLRDKVNAIVTVANKLGGGAANQILFSKSTTDFDVEWRNRTTSSTTPITFATGWAGSAKSSISAVGSVEITGDLIINTGGTITVGTLDSAYRPVSSKRMTISDYNGSDGASSLMIINIATDGTITIYKQADGTKPANRGDLQFTINYNALV